jgi:hypothetical protein
MALQSVAVATVQPQQSAFAAADLVWEQVEEAAVRAYRAGGADAAQLHWRRGLAVARQHFVACDPRIGTSLVNYGFALRRRGEAYMATRHFTQAEEIFGRGERWLDRMVDEQAPDGMFDDAARESFAKLIARARTTSRAIRIDDEIPVGSLEQWRRERPAQPSDVRKLLASALLFVSRAG